MSSDGRIPGTVPFCAGRQAVAHTPGPMIAEGGGWKCSVCDEADPEGGRRSIEVETETGRTCVVEFESRSDGVWSVDISQELIDTAPEGLVAALSMAVMEMKS